MIEPEVNTVGVHERICITRDPLDSAVIALPLRMPESGAVVVFEGIVRAEKATDGDSGAAGGSLLALDYQAYEQMAVEQMQQLRQRALRTFEILDAAMFHRLGRLAIGEVSVVVAVSAAHRGPAFEACQWLMDTLKVDVPIWKSDIWQQQ